MKEETQKYVSYVMKNALELDINHINDSYNQDTETDNDDDFDDDKINGKNNTKNNIKVERMEVVNNQVEQVDNNNKINQDTFKDIDSYVDPLNS
jgi:hypothetical protein